MCLPANQGANMVSRAGDVPPGRGQVYETTTPHGHDCVLLRAGGRAGADAAAGRPEEGLDGRYHRIRLSRTACGCCCFPTRRNPKITVNVTYLVGSRHEGYGETGMAHLLEHLNFIETTNGRKIKNELVGRGATGTARRRYDRTNYYETVHRHRREPEVGARPRSRSHGERQVHQADSRHRNDRRAQRVRARREQPAVHPARARGSRRRTSGTTTASRPSARRRIWKRCRSSAWRPSTGSSTSPTTRCW